MNNMQDFEIVGSFNNQRILSIDPERSVNLFEYIDPLGKKQKSLLCTSGLQRTDTFFSTVVGASRATFVFQGVGEADVHMYQVFGFDVYRIDTALNASLLFSFTSSSNVGYVGVDANTHQVIFVDGQQGWIWDTLTSQATQITDPNFPAKPIDVCNLDGFFVVANGDTNTFQLSMFNQGLVWGGGVAATFTASTITNSLTPTGANASAFFATGIPFQVSTTGTLPMPLVNGSTIYYTIFNPSNPGVVKVAASFSDAVAGIFITLTSNGTPTNTMITTGQLQLGSITSHPGNIVACRTLHRRLFLFSVNFTEVWENQGIGANLPFRRNNSLLIEYGTPALGSIATGFDSMFFLSNDKDGLGAVMQVSGTQAIPVSNRALDFALAGYAQLGQVADARAFLIKENGLIFYQLNFTQANHTYVYDMTLSNPSTEEGKLWHEKEVLNGNRDIAQTHGYFNGINYVFSYLLPRMYQIDPTFFTNDGEAIRRMRISRSFVDPGYRRIRIDRFQLDLLQGSIFSQGFTPVPLTLFTESSFELLTEGGDDILAEQPLDVMIPNDSAPTVYLSISRDGGQTFGYQIPAPMGQVGQRSFRTVWRKLGTIPRGQGFVVKILFFQQYPFTILGAGWAIEVMPE
jgi:hypothetical protein